MAKCQKIIFFTTCTLVSSPRLFLFCYCDMLIFKDVDVKYDLSCDLPHVLFLTLYNLFIYTNTHYVIVII